MDSASFNKMEYNSSLKNKIKNMCQDEESAKGVFNTLKLLKGTTIVQSRSAKWKAIIGLYALRYLG